jgi:hypothetical protein
VFILRAISENCEWRDGRWFGPVDSLMLGELDNLAELAAITGPAQSNVAL